MLVTLSQNASSAISELLKKAPKHRGINQHNDEQMNQIINTDICVRIRLKCFG